MEKSIDILSAYSKYVLTNNTRPSSVFAFMTDLGEEENKFYNSFSSFSSLEESFFTVFYHNTKQLIEEYPNYLDMNSVDKMLTFYYTYIQVLTENRSLVIFLLKNSNGVLKSYNQLSGFKKLFQAYVSELDFKITGVSNIITENVSSSVLPNAVWIQFISILKFWLSDNSKGFEKTDVFIEKSVKAGNDLLDLSKLSSFLDLGKFLYNEKIKI
jgi:hypothetical protein